MTNPSAGPWRTGEPPREGRYLIEWQGLYIRQVMSADYDPRFGWSGLSRDQVLRWAEINPPEREE